MRTFSSAVFFLLLACLPAFTQNSGAARPGLDEVLREASKRRREYVEAFRNLTADETKITEIFDGDGRPGKRRKQLAHFLVYQSRFDGGGATEYRFVREVDDKPVNDQLGRAEKLFNRLADSKTPASEYKKLRDENMRHTLRYYRWNMTLHPAGQLEEKNWSLYSYEIAGREGVGDRETIVVTYRGKALRESKAGGVLRDFKDPQVGDRGRVWLDATTFQIRRWENEWIVRHKETGEILVYIRDEMQFAPSEFGILVPEKIVASFFDKLRYKSNADEPPRALLGGRITYTYGPFKRFNITSREEINPKR
jgi:hypothetical protein